ncbi:MAG TPA: methyltransferase domain-containing protein [Thermoleophilia bacterium]
MCPDEKSQTDDGVVYRFASEWITKLEGEGRWRLYWQQQKLMEDLVRPGQELLEIGPGNGFTSGYLRDRGFDVTTLDIDADKHPDIAANIVTYDFPRRYDAVLAFEVFEHIPFEKFEEVVGRLAKAAREYVFISLPRNELVPFRLSLKLGSRRREHGVEYRRLEGKIREVHHFWELDHGDTTVARVERLFASCGLHIERRRNSGKFRYYALRAPRG